MEQYYFLGTLFFIFNNAVESIFIGKGDIKKIIYLSIFSAVINFIIDPLFIYVLKWGISEAAISTIISIVIVSIFNLYLLAL
jgi:Na+-driven multidrug efflux pump